MEDSVAISVIIPAYNVEKYINQCLESVIYQTLENIEIIAIDDGSVDNTRKMIENYANLDSRVKLISQNNRGLSAVRNRGIEVACGEIIFFLDGDDYIVSDILQSVYERMQNNNLELLLINYQMFEDKTDKIIAKSYLKNSYNITYKGVDLFVEMYLNHEHISGAPFHAVRRSFLLESKIKFCEGIIHEDEHFSLTIMLVAKRCEVIEEPSYFYRVRSGSIMTSKSNEQSFVGYTQSLIMMLEERRWLEFNEKEKKVIYAIMIERWNFLNDFYWAIYKNNRKQYEDLYNKVKQIIYNENYLDSKIVKIKCKFPVLYFFYYRIQSLKTFFSKNSKKQKD